MLRGWIPCGLMPIFGHLAAWSEAVKAVEAYDGRDVPPGNTGDSQPDEHQRGRVEWR